jgi:hypothetical protein
MFSACVKIVNRLVKSFGKPQRFLALSTMEPKYLTSQVFFIRDFPTKFTQQNTLFTQPWLSIFNLSFSYLSSFSPPSIKATKN